MTLIWGVPLALTAALFQTLGLFGYLAVWRYLRPDQPIPLSQAVTNGAVLATSLAVSAPLVIGLLFWIVRMTRISPREYLALKWPGWREWLMGAVGLVIVLGGTDIFASLLGKDSPAFISDTFTTAQSAGMLPLLVVSFVILAPLQEELVFRGFFFAGFAPVIGTWPAIIVTAGVWALSHGQYEWFFIGEIFALGLLFGWLRARTGSTILTFALHACVNGMAVVATAAGLS